MNITSVMGTLAAILITLGYMPQTIKTIRTRSTGDIAIGSFILMGLGSLSWAIYGILAQDYFILSANALTTIMSTIIFSIKLNNDWKVKKKRENG
ncbi:MAG: hypothetical protein LIP08_09360 [Bacteroides sp.]|nr:hypothetical protein [Bacteroides sp.]